MIALVAGIVLGILAMAVLLGMRLRRMSADLDTVPPKWVHMR